MSQGVNAQTGTSYTIRRTDRGKLVTFSNAAPVAVTIPQAIAQFGEGFSFETINRGAGTVTFTPASGTINGAASLALTTNNYAQITSDGTNWDAGLSGTGPTGATGATGAVGPAGTDGKTILNGVVDPTTQGVDGDFYINTANNKIFGPKASGVWPAGISVVGPAGAAGAAGAAGSNGTNGLGYVTIQSKSDAIVNNVTTLQTLLTFEPMPNGVLNVINRVLTVKVNGYYTTAGGETPTLTFDLYMAAASRAQVVTPALAASKTNVPFELEFRFLTHGIDAGGALHRSAKVSLSIDGVAAPSTFLTLPNTTSDFALSGALAPLVGITAGGTNLASISAVISTLRVE